MLSQPAFLRPLRRVRLGNCQVALPKNRPAGLAQPMSRIPNLVGIGVHSQYPAAYIHGLLAHGTTVLCDMLMEHGAVADKRLKIAILRGVFGFLRFGQVLGVSYSNDTVVQHCVLGRHCHANVSRLARQCCHLGVTLSCPSLGCPPGP